MPCARAKCARTNNCGAKPTHVPYVGAKFVVMSCKGSMVGNIPPPSPTMQQGPLAGPVMEQNFVICPMRGQSPLTCPVVGQGLPTCTMMGKT